MDKLRIYQENSFKNFFNSKFLVLTTLFPVMICFACGCDKKSEEANPTSSQVVASSTSSARLLAKKSDKLKSDKIKLDKLKSDKNRYSSLSDEKAADNSADNSVKKESLDDEQNEYQNLMLVNKENALPADFQPDLAQLGNGHHFDSKAAGCLTSMIEDAKKAGVNLFIVSSYRSNERQTQIFNNKLETLLQSGMSRQEAYDNTALYIAPPGTSEHATGLAVDLNSLEEDFDQTTEYKWLSEHAAEYGFILRYQKEKQDITQIAYEPWHYRYVGKKHAEKIKSLNVCLEEYLEKHLND